MTDVEQDLARIDERGFVVIERLLDDTTLNAVSAALAPHLRREHLGRNPFEGLETERVYSLPALGAVFADLVEHPRKPLARDKLMELARGREHEAYDRAIDVQVSRLRKVIEPQPSQPRFIQTVWGFGYVFVPDGGQA